MKIKEGFKLRNIMGQPTIVGEGVAQIDFGKLITLNSSAAFLWENIQGKEFTDQDLANLLQEKYDIDKELALNDSKFIAEEWIKNGLIDK